MSSLILKHFVPPPTPLNLPLLVLMFQFGLVLVLFPLPLIAWGYAIGALVGLVVLFVGLKMGESRQGWQTLFLSTVVASTLAVLVLSWSVTSWPSKVPIVVEWARRYTQWSKGLSPFFRPWQGLIHPNTLGLITAAVLPLHIGNVWQQSRYVCQRLDIKNILRGGLAWGALAIQVFFLLVSQSRGAYLATLIATIVMLFWLLTLTHLSKGKIVVISLVLGSIIFVGLYRVALDFSSLMPTSTGSLIFRVRMWRYALLLVASFPYTGIGFRALRWRVFALFPPQVHPIFTSSSVHFNAHNMYLQTALDLGLPGLIAFLALVVVVFWMWSQVWKARQRISSSWHLSPVALLALLGSLVGQLVFGMFESNGMGDFTVGWVVIALITALFYRFVCRGEYS